MEKIILEVVPPPMNWSEQEVNHYIANLVDTLKKMQLSSICIPEVVEEDREGERTIAFSPKMDPILFTKILKNYIPHLKSTIFKVVVLIPKENFRDWVKDAENEGISEIVLVGPGRHDQVYPGYSVIEATKILKSEFPHMKVGALTIFSRSNEAERIFDKIKAGIDFFYSQIIFETTNAELVLSLVQRKCLQETYSIPPIYLSLSVAAHPEDIRFLKWLGVEFPSGVLHFLQDENQPSLEEKALKVNQLLLESLSNFMKINHLPIFFKVEYVVYNNLPLSSKLQALVQKEISTVAQ